MRAQSLRNDESDGGVDDDDRCSVDEVCSPDPIARAEGWRLHLARFSSGTVIAEEKVLPEKVDDPDCNRVEKSTRIWLTAAEVRWLHEVLGKVIAEVDAEDAADVADGRAPGSERP